MAHVEEVEAAVGEDHPFPLGLEVGHDEGKLGQPHDLLLLVARAPFSSRSISPRRMGAVPRLVTTTPAARLARAAASLIVSPAASPRVRTATTVSPAPETSKTSRAGSGP